MRSPFAKSAATALSLVLALSVQSAAIADEQPLAVLPAHIARIKDLAYIEGIRDNMLIGYGLVVGLNGTGDKQQTIFSVQTLGNMLQRMGVNIQNQIAAIQVRNIAAVFVTATLPPFSRPGIRSMSPSLPSATPRVSPAAPFC